MTPTRAVLAAVGSAVLLAALVGAAWQVAGGRWLVVETWSMGTSAPVGSLVQVSPVALEDLRVGDLVTVRPAGSTQTWTHEVVSVSPSVRTAGRLTGPDPWRIDQQMLVGRADAVIPGAGWLVRGLPMILLAALLTWGLLVRLPREVRLPAAMLLSSVAVSGVLVALHPLQGAAQVAVDAQTPGVRGSWVNTGVLPMRVDPGDGSPAQVVATGEVAEVDLVGDEDGTYVVEFSPEVPTPLWAGLAGLWVVPAVLETWRRRPTLEG